MKAICKYCLEEDYITNLIRPCKCTGSMKYVHASCFYKWNKLVCEICHYQYKAKPHPLTRVYTHLYCDKIQGSNYVMYILLWRCLPFLTFHQYNKYICELLILCQLFYARHICGDYQLYMRGMHCIIWMYILLLITTQLYVWIGNAFLALYGFVFLQIHINIMATVKVYKTILNYNQ